MTIAELREKVRDPHSDLDDTDRFVVGILIDSGADPTFVREAAETYLRDRGREAGTDQA